MGTPVLENIVKSPLLMGHLSRLWVCCAADGDRGPFQAQGCVMAWTLYSASPAIAAITSCSPEALWQILHSVEPQQLNHGGSELCAGCT